MKKVYFVAVAMAAVSFAACSNKQQTTDDGRLAIEAVEFETEEEDAVVSESEESEAVEAQTGATEQTEAAQPKVTAAKKRVKLRTQNDSLNYLAGFGTGLSVRASGIEITDQMISEFVSVLDAGYKGKEVNAENYENLDSQVFEGAHYIGQTISQQERESGLMGIKGLATNMALIEQGFVDGLAGDESRFTGEAANEYLFNVLAPLAQAQQEEMAAEAKKTGAEFLAENAKREGVKTTASGLQYEVIEQGDGEKPTAESTVKVHYEGKLVDGTIFDSSYQRGEPIEFPLNGVIRGWTEGLQLMPAGSTYMLYIPYDLGYGERGAGASIPPYATLIFKVELLEVK